MANLYDVQVMTDMGTWTTDMTTGSKRRAIDRGRYLHVRTIATQVIDRDGKQVLIHAHA